MFHDGKTRLARDAFVIGRAPTASMPSPLRNAGLSSLRQADVESATGHDDFSRSFAKWGRIVADVAIGIDPITGTARAMYELTTGMGLVSGQPLSQLEAGFAAVNLITLAAFADFSKGAAAIVKLGKVLGGARGKAVTKLAINMAKQWPIQVLDRLVKARSAGATLGRSNRRR